MNLTDANLLDLSIKIFGKDLMTNKNRNKLPPLKLCSSIFTVLVVLPSSTDTFLTRLLLALLPLSIIRLSPPACTTETLWWWFCRCPQLTPIFFSQNSGENDTSVPWIRLCLLLNTFHGFPRHGQQTAVTDNNGHIVITTKRELQLCN